MNREQEEKKRVLEEFRRMLNDYHMKKWNEKRDNSITFSDIDFVIEFMEKE